MNDISSLSKYEIMTDLGEGTQGTVKLAKNVETGIYVAIKISEKKGVDKELKILQKISHKNICKLLDYLVVNKTQYIVLEYLPIDLFSVMDRDHLISLENTKRIGRELLSAVSYCHENNIIHRDIKPENILLTTPDIDKAEPKLCDFGMAVFGDNYDRNIICGSDAYMAPELSDRHVDVKKTDIWSIGIVLYNIYTSFVPWSCAKPTDPVFETYCRKQRNFVSWTKKHSPHVNDKFISLFTGMCNPDPNHRFTSHEALRHDFFT